MAYGKNLKVILKMRYTISDAIAIEEHEGAGRTSTGGRVSLRPIRPDDEAFLSEVYASTRLDGLADGDGWRPRHGRTAVARARRLLGSRRAMARLAPPGIVSILDSKGTAGIEYHSLLGAFSST